MPNVEDMKGLAPGRFRAERRWGEALESGFTIVPDVLIKNQGRLGLAFRELGVLLQLISFWWTAEEWPRPQVSTLAKRMGVDDRTVQRSLSALVDCGLIARTRVKTKYGDFAQGFDLSGLVTKLEQIARQGPALSEEDPFPS